MNNTYFNKIQVTSTHHSTPFQLPKSITDAYNFANEEIDNGHKNICLIFPQRENSAQWIAFLFALDSIHKDYEKYKDEILTSYKSYKPGQLLLLNNTAIVKWVGYNNEYIMFSTRPEKNASAPIRFAKHADVIKLQPNTSERIKISTFRDASIALKKATKAAIDKLFGFYTAGNTQFMKTTTCLVDKFKDFDTVLETVLLNGEKLTDFISPQKIDDEGSTSANSALYLSNNIERIIYNLERQTQIKLLVIDSISQIKDSKTNFEDINNKKIPVILITDISELKDFDLLKEYNFHTRIFDSKSFENYHRDYRSPFHEYVTRLENFNSFKIHRDIYNNSYFEEIATQLFKLPTNERDNEYTKLKIALVNLLNKFSRICHRPDLTEIGKYKNIIIKLKDHFNLHRYRLGHYNEVLLSIINSFSKFIVSLESNSTEKNERILEIDNFNYDFIVCFNDEEKEVLKEYLENKPISIKSLTDLDEMKPKRDSHILVTGWPQLKNMQRLCYAFSYSQITFLFYEFENRYYLYWRRKQKAIIEGTETENEQKQNVFYNKGIFSEIMREAEFAENQELININKFGDIAEFELNADKAQFTRYYAGDNMEASCRARRIDFNNNVFMYATETHKFLVINELLDEKKHNARIYSRVFENLKTGDVIPFISTDRDILVDIVEKTAEPDEYRKIKKWVDLWKNCLQWKYAEINYDMNKLYNLLTYGGLKRHRGTVRNWLNDENMIGPEEDADLKVIARVCNSDELLNNISNVRDAISQMTRWRMKAADFIRDRIKSELAAITNRRTGQIKIEIEGMGSVNILRVTELVDEIQIIDKKFVNRFLWRDSLIWQS